MLAILKKLFQRKNQQQPEKPQQGSIAQLQCHNSPSRSHLDDDCDDGPSEFPNAFTQHHGRGDETTNHESTYPRR